MTTVTKINDLINQNNDTYAENTKISIRFNRKEII